MAKYKNKSEYLQKQYDEKNYGTCFDFITILKIDSTIKWVLTLMANDTYMNGSITWKQSTYADKLGFSRRQMVNIFNNLIELKVIIPHKDNKEGGKQNTYTLTNNFEPLLRKPKGFAKKTCEPQCTKPVHPNATNMCTAMQSVCEPGCTYNTDNTCLKHVLILGKRESFEDSSSKPEKPSLPKNWLELMDIK